MMMADSANSGNVLLRGTVEILERRDGSFEAERHSPSKPRRKMADDETDWNDFQPREQGSLPFRPDLDGNDDVPSIDRTVSLVDQMDDEEDGGEYNGEADAVRGGHHEHNEERRPGSASSSILGLDELTLNSAASNGTGGGGGSTGSCPSDEPPDGSEDGEPGRIPSAAARREAAHHPAYGALMEAPTNSLLSNPSQSSDNSTNEHTPRHRRTNMARIRSILKCGDEGPMASSFLAKAAANCSAIPAACGTGGSGPSASVAVFRAKCVHFSQVVVTETHERPRTVEEEKTEQYYSLSDFQRFKREAKDEGYCEQQLLRLCRDICTSFGDDYNEYG